MSASFQFLQAPPASSDLVYLDSSDDRLLEICDLYGARSFSEAHDRCNTVVGDKIYDFRLIGIHVFCIIWDEGPTAIRPAFEALRHYLENHGDDVGPEKHRRKIVSLGMKSLLDHLTSTLKYWQTEHTPSFEGWIGIETREGIEETIDVVGGLSSLSDNYLDYEAIAAHMATLTQMLRGIQKSLPSREQETDVMSESSENQDVSAAPEHKETQAPQGQSQHPFQGSDVSPELVLLLKKIQAFESLVAAKRFERAAMVADDIQSTVDNFDPRKFFPTLFADFYADLVQNFDAISSFWARRDSADWRVLQQLYEVDIDTFVEK